MSAPLLVRIATGSNPIDLYNALIAAVAVLGAAGLSLVGDRHPRQRAPRNSHVRDPIDTAYHAELVQRAVTAEQECAAVNAKLSDAMAEIARLRDRCWQHGVNPNPGQVTP